ncbi:unnamed protein product [Penicillium olsonii]|uniref:Uncharacterized protein n=1 Tax=Penicillium olsonii TaxID=99116 RepID=A0A9W4HNC2_PENOL|nr:unnamed protein product [Penicillium olsonii]CAG8256424.1 unnamed protein product [Penicillium olsonii]
MSCPPKNEFQIGWICALAVEVAAAKEMLDEKFDQLEDHDTSDTNTYTLGRIGKHNIVIAGLPTGQYGTTSATTVANHMARTFSKSLRVGLMVGIGGGIPTPENDVRLGDVVISCPVGTYGGVVQYDMGKHIADAFTRTGSLNSPPRSLLTAISRLRADELTDDPQYYDYIQSATDRTARTKKLFRNPGPEGDRLFKVENDHPADEISCDACPSEWEVVREAREDDLPRAHYGLIASGNSVIKDARSRENLGEEIGALCFEMEAAGLMLDFPCIVIRGISDYSDSHKNKQWQGYAALVAASYAKELLGNLPHSQVTQERLAVDICHSIENLNDSVRGTNERLDKALDQQASQFDQQRETKFVGEHHKCHKALKTSNYESFKDINPSRASGTCQWVLESPTYLNWRDSLSNSLLWVSADPGCGKSVLSKSLIDIDSKTLEPRTMVAHFFFKDNEQQNRLNIALCALLHQIFSQEPALISHAMDRYNETGDRIQHETSALWDILLKAVAGSKASQIICVLDALDECHSKDVEFLIQKLREVFGNKNTSGCSEMKTRLKFFVTSRPYLDIQAFFSSLTDSWPQIRLRGEEESDQIKKEIDIVIRIKMQQVAREAGLSSEVQKRFETQLQQMENRTYLWLHLALEDIRTTLSNSVQPDSESIRHIPPTVDAAYANILARVQENQFLTVKTILLIICGARRPLTIQEMAIALGIALKPESSSIRSAKLDPIRLSSRIRSLCGLFVIITDSRVYFLHQTAKEFLIRDGISAEYDDLNTLYPLGITDTESTLAEICVRFLLIDDFRDPRYQFDLRNVQVTQLQYRPEHPVPGVETFLHYSAIHWARHVRLMSSSRYSRIEELIRQLYDTSSQPFPVWFDLFWHNSDFGLFWSVWTVYNSPIESALCLAALNGHENMLRGFLSESRKEDSPHWTLRRVRNSIREYGTSAFVWASWAGNYDICCILLNQGAHIHKLAMRAAFNRGNTEILQLLLARAGDAMMGYINSEHALQEASRKNDLGTVLFILDAGCHVDAGEGTEFGTALEKACYAGSIDVVKSLLDRGADIHARGSSKFCENGALLNACLGGNFDVAEILLGRGAQVDRPEHSRKTPLLAACMRGNVDLVKLLVEKGADVNRGGDQTPLELVCHFNSIEMARILLEAGADVNASPSNVSSYLTLAFGLNHIDLGLLEEGVEAAKLLLDRGADINARMGSGDTPLEIACQCGHIDIIQVLLQNGAQADHATFVAAATHVEVMGLLRKQRPDFNAVSKDTTGMTALEAASRTSEKESVEYLLNIGAHNQSPSFQRALDSALIGASELNNSQGVKILLDAGASLQFYDKENLGALQNAARSGSIEFMKMILKRGADISLNFFSVHEKKCALEIALLHRRYEALKVLLSEFGNGIRITDLAYSNALLSLCWSSERSMEEFNILLRAGASAQFQDDSNMTALHIACLHLDLSLVKLFLQHGASANCLSTTFGSPLHIVCSNDIDIDLCGRAGKANRLADQLELVRVLLKHGAGVDGHGGLSHRTPLIEASQVGHVEVVMLLIQEGAKINAIDKYQFSALMLAAAKGHAHIVRVLLSHGAHINYRRTVTKFDEDETEDETEDESLESLYTGARVYDLKYVSRGIHGNEPWETALQAASYFGSDRDDDPMMKLLLENGALL